MAGGGDEAAAPERLEAVVHGRVQGVGFRWFVREEARRLGLGGWVRNRADGAVELSAEGDPAALRRLVDRLEQGPPGAVVERLDISHGPTAGATSSFEIRPGSHGGD